MTRSFAALALASSLAACSATTAPGPASAPASVATPIAVPAGATVTTALPPPPITASEILTQGRAPFDACFALAKKTNPNIPRTSVEITFNRDEDGKLLNVEFVYRNRFDDNAKDCMRHAAEAVTFPATLKGQQVGTIVFTP